MPQPETKHIIHKLSVEFNLNGKEDSVPVKDKNIVFVKETILPALEQVLDELDDGQLIRIDQLDLQLDNIDPKQIKQELLKKIREQFPARIQTAMQKETIVKNARSVLDTLEHFLNSGLLPWWDHNNEVAKIEATILADLLEDRLDKKRLKSILTNSNQERLILQLSDPFFKNMFNYYFSSEEIWQHYSHLKKLLEHHFSPRLIRKYFLQAALEQLKNNVAHASMTDKISSFVLHQLHQDSADTFQVIFSNKLPPVQAQIIQKWQEQKWIKPEQVMTTEKKINQSSNSIEEIYIQNAGLVLLHPFFVFLFKGLEYTQGDNFVDTFHQQQAALALQYLLTPKQSHPEHQLALNKILCGIPLDTPVESKLILSNTLREQTTQLLHATIKHWSALKNTSPEGLRNNFLLREGKLTRKADGDWKLFVEYQTPDILLSKLNWNYSLVKLPWMTNILWVEWG